MTNPVPVPPFDAVQRAIAYPMAGPAGPDGPQGPQGPPGPASALPATWWGDGPPPDLVEGSKPGDTYIDRITGTTYTLT